MASQYETYLRRYLNDNGTLWTSAQIERWAKRAENELSRISPLIRIRRQIPLTANVPLYTIPPLVYGSFPSLGINQITYKGQYVIPLSQQRAREMFPFSVVTDYVAASGGAFESTAFESTAFFVSSLSGYSTYGSSPGRPQYWAYTGYDEQTIQFFPTPNETIAYNPSGFFLNGSDIPNYCVLEYRSLQYGSAAWEQPLYRLVRQVIKDFVLSEAFAQEGKGQQIRESKMLRTRYERRLELFKVLATNIFVANNHRLGGNAVGLAVNNFKPNFGNDLGRRSRW